MKILISGVCGFVGNCLAQALLDHDPVFEIVGFDNFSRPGSERNRGRLHERGVKLLHADVRAPSDLEFMPRIDWIIDAAANPSVLAGTGGATSSRQLLEHNLYGTVNLLELAKRDGAGFILLSTNRVYSIAALAALPVLERNGAFTLDAGAALPPGVSSGGIAEDFSTTPPLSLYGSSKLASELIALEYGETFGFPVWINRCGVLAGAGQFGRADQGIFAYWINAWLRRQPLQYIGFGGRGSQTRDCLHPADLIPLLMQQIAAPTATKPRVVNLGGGPANAMSLAQLSTWCAERFGVHEVQKNPEPRRFDIPWAVMDSRTAAESWDWNVQTPLSSILEEIAVHAEAHSDWLELSAPL